MSIPLPKISTQFDFLILLIDYHKFDRHDIGLIISFKYRHS